MYHYTGPPNPYDVEGAEQQAARMASAQFVLTDLGAVRREYHYLQAEVANRAKRRYISPLYQVQWRRVMVDEVQEVEGQLSRAAQMLRSLK